MDNKVKKLLFDINESIDSIEDYLGEKRDFTKYLESKMLRREFEIIGEAMGRIRKIDPDIQITGSKQIVNMRNRVIHGYDKIDHEIVWGTIVRHLPILKEEVKSLLEK